MNLLGVCAALCLFLSPRAGARQPEGKYFQLTEVKQERVGSSNLRTPGPRLHFNPVTGGLEDLEVLLDDSLDGRNCKNIIANLKETLHETSRELHRLLESRLYLQSVNLELPASWTSEQCGQSIQLTHTRSLRKQGRTPTGDVVVTSHQHRDNSNTGQQHPSEGRPHVLHSGGCGQPGDRVQLAYSYVEQMNGSLAGHELAQQLVRYRYGIFANLGADEHTVVSLQYARCRGKTAREVVFRHPDFQGVANILTGDDGRKNVSGSGLFMPRINLIQRNPPKVVIVLENSVLMNSRDQWDFIRAACKKFLLHDLPAEAEVGLVLFNDEAHVAHPVSRLGKSMISSTRNSLAFSVKSKHNLSPRTGSCVRCGVLKALEALQNSGSSTGAALVIISRGAAGNGLGSEIEMELEAENDLIGLAVKHSLQLYPVTVPQPPLSEVPAGLDRLGHYTAGASFLVTETSYSERPDLAIYMGLVDSLRQIQSNLFLNSPQLLYERKYQPVLEAEEDREDGFLVDRYVGHNTEFNVFFPDITESYIKSMSVRNAKGASYHTISDSKAGLHYYTMYGVPFDLAENIGLQWNYSLVRLPSPTMQNAHVVQVTSASQSGQHDPVEVFFWTNRDRDTDTLSPDNEVEVTPDSPLILYAGVYVRGQAVAGARVVAELEGLNRAGFPVPMIRAHLLDSGNGDPDMHTGDGIYSRYLVQPMEEGRYTVNLIVTHGSESEPTMVRSDNSAPFRRIVRGHSFRVAKILRRSSDVLPPSRVMDFSVDVLTSSQQLEFSWSAPGDDFDEGKPTSYQLLFSEDPGLFYSEGGKYLELVESFSGVKSAGGKESYRIFVKVYNKNLYYALVAVDEMGNMGQISNIVKAYMPQPYVVGQMGQPGRSTGQLREGLFNPFESGGKEPNKVVMYAVVGVVTVVIFTFLVVMLILVILRKLSRRGLHSEHNMSREEEEDFYNNKENNLVRFSSVDINIHNDEKLAKYNEYTEHHHHHHYAEYVAPQSNFTSQDNLFGGSKDSTLAASHNNMVTFMDPYRIHGGQEQTEPVDDGQLRHLSPIYSKPIPKKQRQHEAMLRSSTDTDESPCKSILKKPASSAASSANMTAVNCPSPREEGDGESDPGGQLTEVSGGISLNNNKAGHNITANSSYLETNLDAGAEAQTHYGLVAKKQGPPTMPKPSLLLDIAQQQEQQQHLLHNVGGTLPRTDPDLVTDTMDRRIRNCTQV